MRRQMQLNAADLAPGEAVVLAELRRPVRTMEVENTFPASPDHMNVGGAMIVRVHHSAKPFEAQHCRHVEGDYTTIPKRLGL